VAVDLLEHASVDDLRGLADGHALGGLAAVEPEEAEPEHADEDRLRNEEGHDGLEPRPVARGVLALEEQRADDVWRSGWLKSALCTINEQTRVELWGDSLPIEAPMLYIEMLTLRFVWPATLAISQDTSRGFTAKSAANKK
jgi:hypothetical protein